MRRMHLAVTAVFLAALISARPRLQRPPDVDSSRLEQLVTVEGIIEHQKALQNIADLNGGTRSTRTPGYTASAAYVKATLEKAGYDARYEMFNMPEWQENAAPVLQQVSPTSKTYVAGSAADDNSPSVDFIAFEHTPTKALTNVKVVPTNDIVIPSPGGITSGCEMSDFPAATSGAVVADPARHVRVHAEAAERREGGRRRRHPFQRGRHGGPRNALFRSARSGLHDPGGAVELRRRRGALQRLQGRPEPDRQPRHQRRRQSRSSIRTWLPRQSAVTPTTWCCAVRTWIRCRRVRA